jgi:hypothetical protein
MAGFQLIPEGRNNAHGLSTPAGDDWQASSLDIYIQTYQD